MKGWGGRASDNGGREREDETVVQERVGVKREMGERERERYLILLVSTVAVVSVQFGYIGQELFRWNTYKPARIDICERLS